VEVVVEFDTLDEPMSCDRPVGPSDTQTLRFIRCEVCGIPVYGEPNGSEPPVGTLCPVCDDKIMAATVGLIMKGHRPPKEKSRVDE
jgi:hypothetical protein